MQRKPDETDEQMQRRLAKNAYMRMWLRSNYSRMREDSEFIARRNAAQRRLRMKYRCEALEHYGGYNCVCCGEKEIAFLTLDHINGGGTAWRKRSSMRGTAFYTWLHRNHYPPGFRVLCLNCNQGAFINGGICPHQQTHEEKYGDLTVLPT